MLVVWWFALIFCLSSRSTGEGTVEGGDSVTMGGRAIGPEMIFPFDKEDDKPAPTGQG